MPVPDEITDLSTVIGSNSPAGSDSIVAGDDYLRAYGAFIRQIYDALQSALTNLTVSNNTVLGDATTDTLNVGAGGIIKDSSGNTTFGGTVGIGTAASALASIGPYLIVKGSSSGSAGHLLSLSSDSASWIGMYSGLASSDNPAITYPSTAALRIGTTTNGGVGGFAERLRLDSSGNFIPTLNTSAPSLTVNQQMVYALTSNTNLRITVRGSDGVTRVTNLTLA